MGISSGNWISTEVVHTETTPRFGYKIKPWRDGRVDEGGGLENRYMGNCIVGSNPTPSAILDTRMALVLAQGPFL